jgi:hypothetical protein
MKSSSKFFAALKFMVVKNTEFIIKYARMVEWRACTNFRKLNTYQVDYIKNYCNNETKCVIIDELLKANYSLIEIINV